MKLKKNKNNYKLTLLFNSILCDIMDKPHILRPKLSAAISLSSYGSSTSGSSRKTTTQKARSVTYSSHLNGSQQLYDDDEDYYLKFNTIAGWQTLLLLQFQPQMYILILLYLFLWYGMAVFMVAFALGCPIEELPHDKASLFIGVLYAGDVGYFIDWISMIIFKNVKWPDINVVYKPRHGFILFIEMVSLIPYEPIYGILVEPNMRVYHCLRLRYTLRLIRLLVYYKHSKEYVGNYSVVIYLLTYFGILVLVVITASGIHYITFCEEKCGYANMDVLSDAIYNAVAMVLFSGVMETKLKSSDSILNTAYASIIFFFLSFIFTSFFACDILQMLFPRFALIRTYQRYRKRIDSWKTRIEWSAYYINFQRLVDEYFEVSKSKINGIVPEQRNKILPPIIHNDIMLDISWVALKHTHLFSGAEICFLRAISKKMIFKFLCPGEVVYKKNRIKSAFVYVIAGNIDVLSEEDGETPIATFTSGTCLGESTLALGYSSVSTVISKDIADVAILKRKDFVRLAAQYPDEVRKVTSGIKRRYERAKIFRRISEYQHENSSYCHERIGVLALKWMKLTLRKLLYDDKTESEDLAYYSKEMMYEMEERAFCTRYLDLLVQSEFMGVTTNSTFVTTKFPVIFRPNSLLIKIWECNIMLHALLLLIFYPIALIFVEEIPFVYEIFQFYITLIWVLDAYIVSSTAVHGKFVQCNTIIDIFLYKLSKLSFLIDLLSSVPLEWVFSILNGKFSHSDAIISYSNRLLKAYRIEMFFRNVQTTAKGIVLVMYFKYFLYFCLLCYYTASILYVLGSLESNFDLYREYISNFSQSGTFSNIESAYYSFILAISFLRDILLFKFPLNPTFITSIPLIIIVVCFETFLFFVLGHTIAIETMRCIDEHASDEFMRNVEITIEVYELEKSLRERIMKYIDLHRTALGNSFLFESDLFKMIPKDLFMISKGIYPGFYMKNLPFFYRIDDRAFHLIAASGSVDIVMPNETFKPNNETCYEFYILMNGFCEIRYRSGVKKIVGPGETFCVLEAAFEMKSLVRITTVTTCRILSIDYSVLKGILFKFPKDYNHLIETVKYFPYWDDLDRLNQQEATFLLEKSTYSFVKEPGLKYYRYYFRRRTKLFYEYHLGFPHSARLLRYFLMHVCFFSSGKFVFYWELFHCICVVAYIFVLYISIVVDESQTVYGWFIARGVLEFFGIFDIYLRHHFSYYNKDNLHITHPYKTAIYYWKHAFLIDLIAWFPFEWILFQTDIYSMMWRLNRLLQLYRVFAFVSYIVKGKTHFRDFWKLLLYLPLIILIINIVSYAVLKSFCVSTNHSYVCTNGTWLSKIDTKSPILIYMYNLNFVIVVLTGSNNGIISINTPIEMHVFLVLTLLQFLLNIIFSAKIVASHLAINKDLCRYQEAMQSLIKFLNYLKIDKKLKWETIKHFEYIWETTKGKRIFQTFSVFKSYFKVDVLYNIYAKNLKKSSIFLQPNENFFRGLLIEAKHELYLKTGIIYQVNDISGDVFILIKGKVEIVGADLNRLETLYVGSVFGNLDNVKMGRRTLSAITSGHVEVLKIDSLTLYKHLSKFPIMLKHFRKLTRFHVDFIKEEYFAQELLSEFENVYRIPTENLKKLYKIQQKGTCDTKIFKNNMLIKIWNRYVIHIVYLLHYMLESFNMSSVNYYSLYPFLYFFDILHIFKIYLELHTSYEDEYGRNIFIRKMIFKRYKKKRLGLYFDLATIFPLELISLAFISSSYFELILPLSRINRLPRVLHTFLSCKKSMHKLNVNVIYVRFRYLFLWVFLALYNLAVVLKMSDRAHDSDGIQAVLLFREYLHVIINTCRNVASSDLKYEQNIKRLFVLNVVLLGTTIISYAFMAECCAILLLLTHTSSKYKHFVLYTKQFMEIENISAPLIRKVENYMNLLWAHHKGVLFPQLLEDSPCYLKEGVLYSMFGNHLMKHPVLSYCHKDLTRQICSYMKTLVFFPGDVVAYVGDIDSCMYFIQEGEIHGLIEDTMYSEVKDIVLQDGDMFGLIQGLYPRIGHEYTYRCISYSFLIVLNREDWIHLLDFFPASTRMIFEACEEYYYSK
nr:uncharacterized protein LOC111413937 isoform X3 [Onthophagus taurus]